MNDFDWKLLKNMILWLIVLMGILIYFWKNLRQLYYISVFPGPTSFPLIGNMLYLRGSLGEISKNLLKLMHEYEPISRFWLGPFPIVAVTSPHYAQKILTDPNALEKPFLMKHLGRPFFGDPILHSDVSKWKRNRKIVVAALSQNTVNSFMPIFVQHSEILIEQLQKEVMSQEPFDVYKYIARATLDTICGAAMGINLNSQLSESPYFDAVESQLQILFHRGYNPWYYSDIIFNMTKMAKKQQQNVEIVFGVTKKVVNEKRRALNQNHFGKFYRPEGSSEFSEKKQFLDYLLDMTDSQSKLSDQELIDEMNIIILGAFETSAISISYILLSLAAKQEIQQKVCDELFTIFGNSDRAIQLEDLNNLKYLEMVMKESMRLFPTVPYVIREATEDIEIDKYRIPRGTTCLVSIIGIHRNKKIWTNPENFDPNRFLPDEIKQRHPFAYIPFSGGPRNCIGIKYAMMFMKVLIVTILRNFEIHTHLKLEEIECIMELSLKLNDGHLVTITPRKSLKRLD